MPLAATGLTFYRSGRRGRRMPNVEAAALLWDHRFAAAVAEDGLQRRPAGGELARRRAGGEIADRLEYRAINEAARCLSDDPFATVAKSTASWPTGPACSLPQAARWSPPTPSFWADCVADSDSTGKPVR